MRNSSMKEEYIECYHLNDDSPFRQGDIIRIESSSGNADTHIDYYKYGIIINADCDLAHKKNDGTVAFLPIFNTREYFSSEWLPLHLISEFKVKITSLLDLILNQTDPTHKKDDETRRHLINWISSDEAEDIISSKIKLSFKVSGKKKIEQVDNIIKTLKLLANDNPGPEVKYKNYCILAGKNDKQITSDIEQFKKSLGDGHFFINELPTEKDIGFIVKLRLIQTIKESHCYHSHSHMMSKPTTSTMSAFRVGRLSETYRFKITQSFAFHFSRIGLPDDITALNSICFEDLKNNYLPQEEEA